MVINLRGHPTLFGFGLNVPSDLHLTLGVLKPLLCVHKNWHSVSTAIIGSFEHEPTKKTSGVSVGSSWAQPAGNHENDKEIQKYSNSFKA